MHSKAILLNEMDSQCFIENQQAIENQQKSKMCANDDSYDIEISGKQVKRDVWSSKIDFLFSCVGYAIGLGNVWRFPYLCYKNGGGAFLIPYGIALVLGGIPMFFLEVSIGQYMSQGGIGIWKISPIFKGIGFGTTLMAFWLNTAYIIVLAWALYYLSMSFTFGNLPWDSCDNTWNSKNCITPHQTTNRTFMNESMVNNLKSSVDEFWTENVLQLSPSMDQIGSVRWELALCLGLAWLICYFCIFKGIKWSGKIVYFTASFPYLLLSILLAKGLSLEGAFDGIKYLFMPKWERLLSSEVWYDAVTQIFFSYGLGIAAITGLGSYNKFNNNCYRDTLFLTLLNEGTCLIAGLVIFSVLGFLSHVTGKDIEHVATFGPGLAFVAYPSAVTQLPISPLWAILFFLMLLFIGLGSQFCALEGFVTAITDEWPKLKKHRYIFLAASCLLSYLIGILFVTEGGMYLFHITNTYACGGYALLSIMFFECIAVSWAYGVDRYFDNIKEMIGYYPNVFWKYCWLIFTPAMCILVFLFKVINYTPFTYNDYVFPWYGEMIGLLMSASSPIFIPIYAIYKIATNKGKLIDIIRRPDEFKSVSQTAPSV